jgi:hypothetical protein
MSVAFGEASKTPDLNAPATETALLNLANERTDKLEPRCATSKRSKPDANLATCMVDTEDPRRAKERTDKLDPSVTKSKTDMEDARRFMPNREIEEPRRMKDRTLAALPS